MKSFLKNVVQRKDGLGGGLVGRTVKVGPFTVRVESHIADGGFACIYKVRDIASGQAFAMKHMRLMGEADAIADCMTEVNTLKKLRDVPSVVTLRAAAFSGTRGNEQEAYLIMDLCKENLVEFVQVQGNKLSSSTVIQIFSSVCQAVAALHQQSPPASHRDLKAENVLQKQNREWVLCDFGSVTDKVVLYESGNAMMMGEEIIRKYTTPSYRAPEMWDLYSRDRIDTKADIWALGCLLYYLMFGKLAFQAEAKLQILNGEVAIPPTRPPPLVALLKELLVVSPVQRPDIVTVLRRLQEVADAMNVDPALLVPGQPPSSATSRRAMLNHDIPAQPLPSERATVGAQQQSMSSQPDMPASQPLHLNPQPQASGAPSTTASAQLQGLSAQQPLHSAQHQGQGMQQQGSASQQPGFSSRLSLADSAALRGQEAAGTSPTQTTIPPPASQRTPSFTSKTALQPSQGSFTNQGGFANFPSPPEAAGFANFDELSPPARPQEDSSNIQPPSPPKPRRQSQPSSRQSSMKSIDAAPTSNSPELASLRKLVAELQSQNQQLQSTVRSQQTTIKQLQVDNFNHVSQLKRLGLDPSPSVVTASISNPTPIIPTQPAAPQAGWASFGSPSSVENAVQEEPLPPVRTSSITSNGSNGRLSPSKARLSAWPAPRSPHSSSFKGSFDAFASQSGEAPGNTLSGQESAHDSPSETMSRHSALSAFAESLKQPALMGDTDRDGSSPLSDSWTEGKQGKSSKRSHRRSTSEPVAIENWNLMEEQ